MYQPGHFDESRPQVLHRLIDDHPLGLLIASGPGGIDATPLPLLHDADGGPFGCLRGHLARANPLWRTAQANPEVLVVFQGPQAYVSPNWYAAKAEHGKVVPTWNYCVVQARGRLRVIDDARWLHALLTRLTDRHEASQPRPWAVDDAPADYVQQLLGAIVGIEIPLHQLLGKWKVSQNRPAADRAGVADALDAAGGEQAAAIASQVRSPGGGPAA